MPTLKASKESLKIIEKARNDKGWTVRSSPWCITATDIAGIYVSEETLIRFRQGKNIQREAFIGICQAVGENW
jgi:hypothetical protein